MKEPFYGRPRQNQVGDDKAREIEEIEIRGYTVIPNLISKTDLLSWRQKIDVLYERQECEFGRDALAAIQELDVCRAPILYEFEFVRLAAHPRILSLVHRFLGDWFILNLQNAIINRPEIRHHQSSWHRDIPYHNLTTSRPLAISALLAIDEFCAETGGTHVIPFSHKMECLPSDSYIKINRVIVSAPAGSAIIFDAMLFHGAGFNQSQIVRRAVNHLYTIPIIKQQYDFPRAIGESAHLDPAVARLLGFTSQVHLDDKAWRFARVKKLQARV